MKYEYREPKELIKQFLPELVEIFDITQLDDLKTDVEENDILNPITLSKDEFVLDGMRRTMVANMLGFEKVKVAISDLEATPENRIALNNFREMTWKDLRNLYIILFAFFGKRQGRRSNKHFDRYTEIAKRTKNRFRDKNTLAAVEFILTNDIGGFPMSRWLFEKNCDVKSIRECVKLMVVGGHDEIFDRVVEIELSPKDAMRIINEESQKTDAKKREFIIPATKKLVAEVHQGEPEELLINIEKDTVKALFYTPDNYVYLVENREERYPEMVPQKPAVYCQKAVSQILQWLERIPKDGSLFLLTREYYKDGFALQIPANLIQAICKETGFVFKQTLFVTNGETLSDTSNTTKGLTDAVPQILWFVKDPKEAAKVFNHTTFLAKQNEDKNILEGTYKSCSNILDNLMIADLIVEKGVEDFKKPDTNYASLIPILAATKEDDLIVDISMKSDIGSVAVLMNRRFIGISNSKSSIQKSAKALTEAVKLFGEDKVEKITNRLSTEFSETNMD